MPDEIAAAAESATVLKFDSQEEYEAYMAGGNKPPDTSEVEPDKADEPHGDPGG